MQTQHVPLLLIHIKSIQQAKYQCGFYRVRGNAMFLWPDKSNNDSNYKKNKTTSLLVCLVALNGYSSCSSIVFDVRLSNSTHPGIKMCSLQTQSKTTLMTLSGLFLRLEKSPSWATRYIIQMFSLAKQSSPWWVKWLWCVKSLESTFKSQSQWDCQRLFQDRCNIMHPLVDEVQSWTNWAIKLTSHPAVWSPKVCSAKRESVPNARVSFKPFYQSLHEAHLYILATLPRTSTCTLTLAHFKDNASLQIQGRVTIGYLASQRCQGHNKSLHQRMQSLSSALQMGVYCLPLRQHLLPGHYGPVSYFHDPCFHRAPVKVHPPPSKHTGTLLFLRHVNPSINSRDSSDKDFNAVVCAL